MNYTIFLKKGAKTVLTLCFLFLFVTVNAKNIYVSKTGNDNNPGTESEPLKTIAKASQMAQAGDIVIIEGGTYEEILQPARSGTAGSPIVYRGKSGEKVIITAMQAVNGWTLDNNSVYKAQVDWDLGQESMALHEDKILDLARWPNNTPQDPFERDYLPGDTGGGRTWLNYSPGIPNWNWEDGGSIHFYGGAGFLAWTDYIKSSTNTKVTFDLNRRHNWIPEKHNPGYTGHGNFKGEFFLQGIRQALDYKNEWYYNKNSKTLYVQIEGGGMPGNNTVRFRKRKQTIKLNQDYIHIENLAVFGGSIDIEGDNNRLHLVSSFYGNHTLGIVDSFDSGNQSIFITGSRNTVEKCEIAYGAGNGLRDRGSNNKILNSYIHHFNYIGFYDTVLNLRGSKNGTFKQNTLSHGGRDVIQAYGDNSDISYNDIGWSNIIADDCGLLYTTNPRNQKSSIHHNTFHDSWARQGRFKATGIYLDNDSKNWDVHHNIVWNTQWTGIQINWNGTNLNIFNNTFCKNKSGTMGAWHKAGTAFSNVKVWNNITDKETIDQVGNQEVEVTWEPQSDKQNNLVSKESFVDWENNNFKLKANAEAVDYGRVIDNYTDGYVGAKPDAGAYEYSAPFVTGIDWDPLDGGPSGSGCYDLPGEACNSSCNTPVIWYADLDGDGLGDPNTTLSACNAPADYVDNNNDSCVEDELNTCTILHEISGLIEVESYTIQQGIQREVTQDVSGDLNIGYIENGDYTEYKTQVGAAGNYVVNLRYASNTQGGTVKILSDNIEVGSLSLSNTGGWQSWETVSTNVTLNSGIHNIRLVYNGNSGYLFNLNWIEFTSTLSNSEFEKEGIVAFPNPANSSITIKGLKKSHEFAIYDIRGRIVKKVETLGNDTVKIELSEFSNGLYLLMDRASNSVYKFIKE